MFTIEEIQQMCMKSSTYVKGVELFQNASACVLDINQTKDGGLSIDADVRGSKDRDYAVHICCNAKGKISDYDCECPAYETYPGMCKHCVAAAIEFLAYVEDDEDEEDEYGYGFEDEFDEESDDGFDDEEMASILPFVSRRKPQTSQEILQMIEVTAKQRRLRDEVPNGKIELVPLMTESYSYYGDSGFQLTFRIGAGKMYVLRNLSRFVHAVANGEMVSYGKQLTFAHTKSAFTKEAWEYVQLIVAHVDRRGGYYGNVGREMYLSEGELRHFFLMHIGKTFDYNCSKNRYQSMAVYEKNPSVFCELTEETDGFSLCIKPICVLNLENEIFVREGNKIYHVPEEAALIYGNLGSHLVSEDREMKYHIEKKDMPAFCGSVLPEMEKAKIVKVTPGLLDEFRPKEAEFRFYLDEEKEEVRLKASAFYGQEEYNLLMPFNLANQYRDAVKEQSVLETAKGYFSQENDRKKYLYFSSADDDAMYQLLHTGISQLEELGEVYLSDSIRKKEIVYHPTAQVGVSIKSGLLELKVDSTTFSREELAGILEHYQKKKKYYRLKNGDFMNLEDNAASAVAELLDGLSLSAKELEQEEIALPKYRTCFVDQILQENGGALQVKRNPDYKALIRDMKNVADSDYEVPVPLEEILRPYQKNGYRWLRTLADLGFGGILADDMGLGKTLQTIAYLLAKQDEEMSAASEPETKPQITEGQERTEEQENTMQEVCSLIVCPASLVYNWKKEIERFAPQLSVSVISGQAEERQKLISKENDCAVWVTSYDTLKRDISLYKNISFDTEIIDEAQNIKNHGTQAAKAVKKIRAKAHFALTGTPIENRLSELWSIFDYLMPGILGKYEKFRKEYELPIVHEQNVEKLEQLKRIVSPFILRRVKQDVLKELPEKMEQVVYAEMEPEQKMIYTAHANRLAESLQNKSAEEIHNGKLQILAELTKLRQICCAPSLVYEDYKNKACKVDACMELVTEAIAGNHKVLIFSQFTSVFPILEKWLGYEKIKYYELTGATPKEKRLEMTEAFNKDDVPVFLISLKAGGTGLNLTAASIVIHFDPWWNIAAQNQATDRAHRIGQTNQVVVFKLIARGTIEEKIIGLQEQKQKLAGQILDAEGISASTLTKEDFMEILKME